MATEITLYFDGKCPLCAREVEFLRKRDRAFVIHFEDISAAEFRPESIGIEYDELMREIHAKLADGTIVRGVEVFRQLYGRLGFSPLVALSRLPGVAKMLEISYSLWAKNRLRLTGRCESDVCEMTPGVPVSESS